MESDTPDVCSWCHRDLRNIPQASVHVVTTRHAAPPPRRAPARQTVVKPEPAPAPPRTAPSAGSNGSAPSPGVPQLGTFSAQKSKYYADKVLDPVSGAHYDADTGEPEAEEVVPIEVEEVNMPVQVAINLVLLGGIAAIAALFVHLNKDLYLAVMAVSNLLAGMAMPLLRTVPFGEDDSSDLPIFLGCTLLLGPFVGALVYGILGVLKQDANPAIVGAYISYLVIRIAMDASIGQSITKLLPFNDTSWQVMIVQLAMPLVTVAGWYAAGMFHKPDE